MFQLTSNNSMNLRFKLFNYLHTLLNLSKDLSSMKRLKGYFIILVLLNGGFLSLLCNPANSELQKKDNTNKFLLFFNNDNIT